LQAFEGMKAYLDAEGRARLFRPEMNMKRMADSMQRLTMPALDQKGFLDCIKEFVKVEKSWIPKGEGFSLYLRPTVIATWPYLGVNEAKSIKLFCMSCPVGPYYPEGFKPVKLLADSLNVRAWPGGVGDSKVGGNYAPTIRVQAQAAKKGYSQILWLFGPTGDVTEVGTMNFFTFWKNKSGEKELITPPLDGTILPGVTRQSIVDLARQWGEFKVTEGKYTIHDIAEAVKEGRVIEAFGAGTAAVVSPIKLIHHNGVDYNIPLDPKDASAGAGPLTKRVWNTLLDIQYGKVKDHPWSVVVN
jgi:branched-chain amino acid aminotransferase